MAKLVQLGATDCEKVNPPSSNIPVTGIKTYVLEKLSFLIVNSPISKYTMWDIPCV